MSVWAAIGVEVEEERRKGKRVGWVEMSGVRYRRLVSLMFVLVMERRRRGMRESMNE